MVNCFLFAVECRAAGFTNIPSMNGCYKVVNRRLNWTVAGQECRSLHRDAHLLVINDAQEQQAVAEMLNSTSGQFLVLLFFIVSQFSHSGCSSVVVHGV